MALNVVDFLIIGAGPTGLGAANRLHELGIRKFLILESNSYVGGLSASHMDDAGFTWDMGGHIFFSRYPYVNQLIYDVMGEDLLDHTRHALIYVAGGWVDYPLQNNIDQLSDNLARECLKGVMRARSNQHISSNFEEWIQDTFGHGISRIFMHPYNRKVWAFPLSLMGCGWTRDRVSIPDVEALRRHLLSGSKPNEWGPNRQFSYPRHGGIGEIFKRLGRRFNGNLLRNHEVIKVDTIQRIARTRNGRKFAYGHLLNTSPLNRFVRKVINPIHPAVADAGKLLKHNRVAVVGLGLHRINDKKRHWMYFPEPEFPFYRVTNLHTYSPYMTPNAESHSAIMAEISYSGPDGVERNALADEVVKRMMDSGVIAKETTGNIVSRWHKTLKYAYPIPCLERDRVLALIHPYLEERNIYSRGRFGGWRYEVGNMDHSVMQGVEWVDRMIFGKKERTYRG